MFIIGLLNSDQQFLTLLSIFSPYGHRDKQKQQQNHFALWIS